MRTEVFFDGAFFSVAAAGETGVSIVGSGLAFTAGLASALASALGAAALVVVFLAVVAVRLRVVVLAVGLA